MSEANDRQVGGKHYKIGGEEHWDRVSRLGLDYFQGQITKYVERWKLKNGVEDLEKARHFLDKYIEIAKLSEVLGGVVEVSPVKSVLGVQNVNTTAGTPKSLLAEHGVSPMGYENFTYEGGTMEWDLYRCKHCLEEVRVERGVSPLHDCPVEPGRGYMNQDAD